MPMKLISNRALREFAAVRPDADAPLQAWRRLIERGDYGSFAAMRTTFASVDKVGERYVFNAAGQEIDVAGLVGLYDGDGACGNAVKDSQRTKTHAGTVRTLSVIWGAVGHEERLAAAVAASNDNDVIVLDPDTTYTLTAELLVGKAITIRGAGIGSSSRPSSISRRAGGASGKRAKTAEIAVAPSGLSIST